MGARVWPPHARARARSRRRVCVARAAPRRVVCADGWTSGRMYDRLDGRTHHAPRTTSRVTPWLAPFRSLAHSLSVARARARRPASSLVPLVRGSSTPVAISRTVLSAPRIGRRVGRRTGGRSIVTCRGCQIKRDSYAHGRAARRAERKPEIRRRRPITALRLRGDSRDISHRPAPPRLTRPLRFRAGAPCERAHRASSARVPGLTEFCAPTVQLKFAADRLRFCPPDCSPC